MIYLDKTENSFPKILCRIMMGLYVYCFIIVIYWIHKSIVKFIYKKYFEIVPTKKLLSQKNKKTNSLSSNREENSQREGKSEYEGIKQLSYVEKKSKPFKNIKNELLSTIRQKKESKNDFQNSISTTDKKSSSDIYNN